MVFFLLKNVFKITKNTADSHLLLYPIKSVVGRFSLEVPRFADQNRINLTDKKTKHATLPV